MTSIGEGSSSCYSGSGVGIYSSSLSSFSISGGGLGVGSGEISSDLIESSDDYFG